MHSEHVHKLNTKLNTKTKRKAILQREMKNTGFLGVACRYFLRIIFSKILQNFFAFNVIIRKVYSRITLRHSEAILTLFFYPVV